MNSYLIQFLSPSTFCTFDENGWVPNISRDLRENVSIPKLVLRVRQCVKVIQRNHHTWIPRSRWNWRGMAFHVSSGERVTFTWQPLPIVRITLRLTRALPHHCFITCDTKCVGYTYVTRRCVGCALNHSYVYARARRLTTPTWILIADTHRRRGVATDCSSRCHINWCRRSSIHKTR